MSKVFPILIVLLVSLRCGLYSESASGTGKSRSELLAEIPYRGEIIGDDITGDIVETLKLVIEKMESLDKVAIFYVTEEGDLKELNGNWENGTSALKQANELWRDIDLIMTIVAYPSYSQDAVTGETSELWAIEVDHKSVSRTCRMFFNTATPIELRDLDCI